MAKVTKVALRVRINLITKLLLEGRTRTFIHRVCADEWKISTRQSDAYIHAASAEIEEANKLSAESNLALITSNLWDIFRKLREKNPTSGRGVLLDIAKLRGLDRIEIDLHVDRPLKDLSDEELSAALTAGS